MTDVYRDILRVAAAINRQSSGDKLVHAMQSRIAAVTSAVRGRSAPKLAFIEWIEPPMSGGHWMPELIAAAGGTSLFGEDGAQSPWITWDNVAASAPDIILVAPCGYDIPTTLREMGSLKVNPVWQALEAARSGQVFVADGNAYFNRPGPRLVETAEIIAEVLHPQVCGFGHAGNGFVRWTG